MTSFLTVIPDGLKGRAGTAGNGDGPGGPGSPLRYGRDDERGATA